MNEKLITDLVDLNPEVLPEGKMPEVLGEYTVTATFDSPPESREEEKIWRIYWRSTRTNITGYTDTLLTMADALTWVACMQQDSPHWVVYWIESDDHRSTRLCPRVSLRE